MCRWIAYSGELIFMDEMILAPANSLIDQSLHAREGKIATNGDGFGVGWYDHRKTPGLYREVLPAWNDSNLLHLSHQIKTSLFFAHVRASTGTATMRTNCHPFSYGRWMFMHNGQIGDYSRSRRALERLLDDALYNHRFGTTDSELMFLLMIQNGLEDDPAQAISATIKQISAVSEQCGTDKPIKLTICLSDGKRLFACRHSSAGTAPTLYWRQDKTCTMIASEPLDEADKAWTSISPDSLLVIDGKAEILPLFPDHPLHHIWANTTMSGCHELGSKLIN